MAPGRLHRLIFLERCCSIFGFQAWKSLRDSGLHCALSNNRDSSDRGTAKASLRASTIRSPIHEHSDCPENAGDVVRRPTWKVIQTLLPCLDMLIMVVSATVFAFRVQCSSSGCKQREHFVCISAKWHWARSLLLSRSGYRRRFPLFH